MATVGLAEPEHAWNKEDVMSQDVDINKLRKNLQTKVLEKQKVDRNPFVQFQKWFDLVLAGDFIEPNALLYDPIAVLSFLPISSNIK